MAHQQHRALWRLTGGGRETARQQNGKTHENYSWQYPAGVVWFNSIILLDEVENSVLRGLKFLDVWEISGTTDTPVICDGYGNDWRNITR